MSDRLPGTSYDNPIWYRGYRIHLGPAYTRDSQWEYSHEDWDGAPMHTGEGPADRRYGMAATEAGCKSEIDEIEDEPEPEVCANCGAYFDARFPSKWQRCPKCREGLEQVA